MKLHHISILHHTIAYQWHWSDWGFQYRKIEDDFGPALHFLIVGPLQARWY